MCPSRLLSGGGRQSHLGLCHGQMYPRPEGGGGGGGGRGGRGGRGGNDSISLSYVHT